MQRRWIVLSLGIACVTVFAYARWQFSPPTVSSQPEVTVLWESPLFETVDLSGAVSADGGSLLHTDWSTGNLVLRDLAVGESRLVVDKGTWSDSNEFATVSAPSPDGRLVAYNWWRSDFRWDLRVTGLDGTEPRILHRFEEGGPPTPVAWSPDSKQLAAFVPTSRGTRMVSR